MPQTRQLAAIMFTDIVGYTALMGQDEEIAFGILEQNRQLQKPIIESHGGRWIKEMGDGVMASFQSASDAVKAAIAIQTECKGKHNFQVRIGIHLGEVVFEKEDVFGDGVNIAARIQAMALPGAVLVSESVHSNVSNKKDIQTEYLRTATLKNVHDPVRIYQLKKEGVLAYEAPVSEEKALTGKFRAKFGITPAALMGILLIASGIFIYRHFLASGSRDLSAGPVENVQKSIAVLPFLDMSPGKDQEYFSDGLSETLIDFLSKVSALKVIGRSSSFSFKGKNEDLRTIGQKLGVSHVLEGSVQKDGNRVRITAQLIDVRDGSQMYSDKFDRELKDIFSIHDEISLAILDAVKLKLVDDELKDFLKNYTDNVEAYQLYLQGRYHLNKFTPEGFLKAIEYFDKAISIDANYAIAYSEKAFCLMNLNDYGWQTGENIKSQAVEAAQKAIQLDDAIPNSHLALGRIKLHWEWKIEEALGEFRKSLQINPNSAQCHLQFAFCLGLLEQHKEAYEHALKAISLDPFSILNLHYVSGFLLLLEEYELVLSIGLEMIELEPDLWGGYDIVGIAYSALRRYEEAIKYLEISAKLNPGIYTQGSFGIVHALMGDTVKAHRVIETLKKEGAEERFNYDLACIHLLLGELDSAFYYFGRALDKRASTGMLWIRIPINLLEEPLKTQVLEDSRTRQIFQKLGLPLSTLKD